MNMKISANDILSITDGKEALEWKKLFIEQIKKTNVANEEMVSSEQLANNTIEYIAFVNKLDIKKTRKLFNLPPLPFDNEEIEIIKKESKKIKRHGKSTISLRGKVRGNKRELRTGD